MPTVALGSDFLDAYARIPRAQQKKVREFTEKFKANPKSPGINYEKIHDVRDDKVRTVRVDQKYRAVVLCPDHGDVYILAWVDNHDEAMAWARKRVFEVNPVTGALQIVNVTEAEQVVQPTTGKKRTPGLLSQFEDDVLLSFGLPAVLLPAVRAVRTPEELPGLEQALACGMCRGPDLAGRGHTAGGNPCGSRPVQGREGGHRRPGGCPGKPGFSPPVRHHPVGPGINSHAGRSAGEMAGLSPPQPGEAGRQEIQRPRQGDGWRRHRQDGGGHAPGQAPGLEGVPGKVRPDSLHDLHGQSGAEHRTDAFYSFPGVHGSHRSGASAEAFQECFYIVPDYQREYVWTDKEVQQLMEDIDEQIDSGSDKEYFVGTILVSPGSPASP